MTDLGTLGGHDSFGWGINASGQVVGQAYTGADWSYNAFLYSNGTMTDLGPGTARGINDSGQVVGEGDNGHAFLYTNGTMTDLGTLGSSSSEANGINASGQVVGYSHTSILYQTHAFLYSNGTMTDLGTLPGGSQSQANGINAGGQVVGWSDRSGGYSRAFLYSNGTMTDLGTLGGLDSEAYGINASGQVVGYSEINGGSDIRAFLYSNGTMTDLNSLIDPACGWTLLDAYAINDSGQIVGTAGNATGQTYAFLLTPTPEPSSAILLTIGAISLLAYAWRRRAQSAFRLWVGSRLSAIMGSAGKAHAQYADSGPHR